MNLFIMKNITLFLHDPIKNLQILLGLSSRSRGKIPFLYKIFPTKQIKKLNYTVIFLDEGDTNVLFKVPTEYGC